MVKKSLLISSLIFITTMGVVSCNNSKKEMDFAGLNTFKRTFYVGDELSLEGMKIVHKKTREEIKNYSLSINEGTILNQVEKAKDITVSSNGFENLTFKIEVLDPNKMNECTIDIYSLNDFHGSFSYDASKGQIGLARISEFINQRRINNPNTILISAGDMWQGGVESNKTKGLLMTDAMNLMHFDAMALGNHEFDWGEKALKDNAKIKEFPFLSSNIYYSNSNSQPEYLQPSKILKIAGIEIGIIGAGSKYLGDDILGSISEKFEFKDPIPLIKEESIKLKESGTEYNILVSHDGGFYESSSSQQYVYEELFTNELNYVDAVFLGHDHRQKEGSFNGVPYIEGGCNGEAISRVSLVFKRNKTSFEHIKTTYEVISTSNDMLFGEPDLKIDDLLEKYKEAIGDVDRIICNFTGKVSKQKFLDIACQAIATYINKNKLLYKVEVKAGVHNSGGVRDDFEGGKFRYTDLIKIFPFSNTLVIMKVNKKQYDKITIKSSNDYVELLPLTFNNGYEYVGTINYVAEYDGVTSIETIDTGINVQDAIEEYLVETYK